jgi:uncharacterized protein YbjT (DUF2867 family)
MSGKLTVLVTGASGNQGGAVARALLAKGHHVRAMTRNADSPAIRALVEAGAEVALGDFKAPESLRKASEGADTAFIMTTPFEAGLEEDTRQGMVGTSAAADAGVGHIVFSSVASVNKHTRIPHFESKWPVEQHLPELGVPWTISAPVWFMDNFVGPWYLPGLKEGKIVMPMPPDRKLQQVAVSDIGAFVATVIDGREKHFGKRYDIAGDELTGEEVAAILSRATGREIQYQSISPDLIRADNEDFAMMFEWFNAVGYSADIEGLRKEFPEVGWHGFEDWAKEQDWDAALKG